MHNNLSHQNDRYFYPEGMPPRTALRIERAIWRGIDTVRSETGLQKSVKVQLYLLQGRNRNPVSARFRYSSNGNTTKRGITLGVSPKFIHTRDHLKNITGTGIHEYTHYLRYQYGLLQGSTTVLERSIEEGIVIFMQTVLSQPPRYLDIRTLNERMVSVCWDKLSNVLNDPMRKHPAILTTQVYREIYYRLGFGIVGHYMDEHPRVTLAQLVKMQRPRLKKFARQAYG